MFLKVINLLLLCVVTRLNDLGANDRPEPRLCRWSPVKRETQSAQRHEPEGGALARIGSDEASPYSQTEKRLEQYPHELSGGCTSARSGRNGAGM